MHSRTVLQVFPKASRRPSDFQLKMPFGSRSLCITGNCEKSFINMELTAFATVSLGLTQIGGILAERSLLIWCAGSIRLTTGAVSGTTVVSVLGGAVVVVVLVIEDCT